MVAARSSSSNTAVNSYWIVDTAEVQTSVIGTSVVMVIASDKTTYNTWDFGTIWGIVDTGNDKTTPYLKDLIIPEKVYLNKLTYYNWQGTGTVTDPFLVYTEDDLNAVRNYSKYNFKLMNDIPITKYTNWEPIIGFTGIFDGNNKKIINLTIDRLGTINVGLFGTTTATTSVIKDITLENVNIKGGQNTGALARKSNRNSNKCKCNWNITRKQ